MSIQNSELTGIDEYAIRRLSEFVNIQNDDISYRAKDGKAELLLTKEKAVLSAHYKNGVTINDTKTTISGPIHFASDPNEIQIAGFWKFNDELLTCLPSTLYTPIPVLRFRENSFASEVKELAQVESALA